MNEGGEGPRQVVSDDDLMKLLQDLSELTGQPFTDVLKLLVGISLNNDVRLVQIIREEIDSIQKKEDFDF